jgi:hypothetical protein
MWGGSQWLIPHQKHFGDKVLVTLKDGKTYAAKDMIKLFEDIKEDTVAASYRDNILLRKLSEYKYPGVPTYCVHGRNLSTETSYRFEKHGVPLGDPYVEDEPSPGTFIMCCIYKLTSILGGDGMVTLGSLSLCNEWKQSAQESGKNFEEKVFDNFEHTGILSEPLYRDYVLNIVAPPI